MERTYQNIGMGTMGGRGKSQRRMEKQGKRREMELIDENNKRENQEKKMEKYFSFSSTEIF